MSKFKGKKVLVVGFGISGVAVAKYMARQGARVTITDLKQKSELQTSVNACSELKLEYELGKHNNKTFHCADLIVVSPGVPLNIKPLEEARERNIPITSEIELAASAFEQPMIAITGTNGKTTTTTLIGEMFKADGKAAYVGGNIGKPLLDYFNEDQKSEAIVAELSSFQLDLTEKLTPATAVFTNLEEDHLDRYPDMQAYTNSKKRLLRACDRNTFVVLNYDDPNIARFGEENPGKPIWFTKKDPMKIGGSFAEQFCGAYCPPGKRQMVTRVTGKEEIFDLSQFRLFGEHNKENLMAAACAAMAMGVSGKAVQNVINTFKGVPHRLEFVRKKDGVYFFNDSKGTNVMSVKRSLQSFASSPIILIAGGRDKNQDFAPLVDLVQTKCKILILLGEAKEKINRAIGDFAETYLVGTFEEGVLLAYQKSRSGDIILLSPGCASQDLFRNFEERGDYFKKIVSQL
ncbi:MAG: UDP-N-acetylmuramoylalanine--D-glutamate ligase [Bdellovibrionales bacterium RIFOXYC1_FULL_54_43]|nr:MAG: UDP-N-acetylmuramoylalanine--D-glutamate ligase [Bdellovibrionales bacterium RIFOXYC1_FULL_54_43]OFZ85415.1 MAG: UDP-N-acetylmuramoylalanine--D-glutamate ligase [Bdellovibrionales bacterium RIFOXYD1_FULL_55_31]